MIADEIVAAFALPAGVIRPTRIHKTVLNDRGSVTAVDRKLVDTAIDRLDWVATFSPASIGVAAGDGATAIQLLMLSARTTPTQRLLNLIHRAIPIPAVLITTFEKGTRISLAPLRQSERVEGDMVVERLLVSPEIGVSSPTSDAFLASLAVGGLSQTSLGRLYEGLVWRVEAFMAAGVSGTAFRLPVNAADAEARRVALARYEQVAAECSRARAAARNEKQLARQVGLAETARTVKTRLDATLSALT
jgi:hypothetical protein